MKTAFAFIIAGIILIPLNVFTQLSPLWVGNFQHILTPGYSNESRKVATDSNGNIFVLCDVTSDFDPNGNVASLQQHYTEILKYTPAGILETLRQIRIYRINPS